MIDGEIGAESGGTEERMEGGKEGASSEKDFFASCPPSSPT